MSARFEVGKKYYSRRDPDRYLTIDYRTPKRVDGRKYRIIRNHGWSHYEVRMMATA